MKSRSLFGLLVLVAIIGVGTFLYTQDPDVRNEEIPQEGQEPSSGGRAMSIEEYVRQNISTLSPEPAVLGGTFYVTAIETAEGKGVVEYEDGHIALVADFTYEREAGHGGITITSFAVRE